MLDHSESGVRHVRQSSVSEPLAVGALVLLFTAFPLLPRFVVTGTLTIMAALTAIAWALHWRVAAALGIFCSSCVALALLGLPSQLLFAIGLALYGVWVKLADRLNGNLEWLRRGSLTRRSVALAVLSVLLAVAALLTWFVALEPDVSDIVETFFPDVGIGLLLLGGLGFSLVNAALEEAAYRGVVMDALDRSIGAGQASVLLQAAAFGTLHFNGFPRGWSGVALAFVFGWLMGLIRRHSGGMMVPSLAHFATDCAIVLILLPLAHHA